MPATVEALFIILLFVLPGFMTLRMKDAFVPAGAKPDALQTTLHSVTISLFYFPLWLFSLPSLVSLRTQILTLAQTSTADARILSWNLVAPTLVISVLIPAVLGILWAIAIWNRWQEKFIGWVYPKLHLPIPAAGVGDNLWDRLWLNRQERPWLTVHMKDRRIYVGQGVEFALSSETREILLGAETRLYDDNWNLVRDLEQSRGEGVWIPIAEVSSIDIHE